MRAWIRGTGWAVLGVTALHVFFVGAFIESDGLLALSAVLALDAVLLAAWREWGGR